MNPVPLDQIAESMVRMRSSLARVELAASRLARDSLTPASRELAENISETVREIDHEIDGSLRTLRPPPKIESDPQSCSHMLAELHDRMMPVLRAHAIEWPFAMPTQERYVNDPIAFERAALVVLRTGISIAGRGGRLALSLVRETDGGRLGLDLTTRHAESPSDEQQAVDALVGLRSFAHRVGATLQVSEAPPDEAHLTLWLDTRGVRK